MLHTQRQRLLKAGAQNILVETINTENQIYGNVADTRILQSPHRIDRFGCAVLVEIAETLRNPADDMYYVFSVQEEVGCRGARPAAFAISPDLALIYDVTGTGDEQGAKPMAVRLGEGVAIKIKDNSVICDRDLVDALLGSAKANGIAAQCEILTYGGTDTSSVQMTGFGCKAGALSIPSRYIHSGVELVDLRDANAAVALTLAYLGGAK